MPTNAAEECSTRCQPLCRPRMMIPIAVLLLAAASSHNVARAENDAPGKPEALSPQQMEQALANVYRRVTPAIVRVALDDERRGYNTGAIVSPDGYVVHGAFQAGTRLKFKLADGHSAKGTALGWSSQWHLGLSKIEEPGPWRHVEMAAPDGVEVGQCVVGLMYPLNDSPEPVRRPLLMVDWVNRSAPGLWFTLSGAQVANAGHWNTCHVIFDLRGRLAGVISRASFGGGIAVTDAQVIKSLWDELAAGKNLDQERLDKRGAAEKPGDPQPAATDEIPRAVNKKVAAASVHIRSAADVKAGKKGWSGTIVSADGLVATCAHHHEMPGADVMVCLPDGRDLAGKVLGVNVPCDIGLVQITDLGPLPFVEMGDSTRLRPGAPCLIAGYGPVPLRARHPLVRASKVAESPDGRWSHLLHSDPRTRSVGGDSGGGLFNTEGQLVAFRTGHGNPSGSRPRPHTNPRVELFRAHWDELHAPFHQSGDSPLAATREELERSYQRAGGSIVEILDGEKRVALATIVASSGLLLTKASVLPEGFKCRLADGRVLPGTVLRTVREHDVAVVKIDADDLAVIEWSTVDDPPIGTAVGLAAADAAPTPGFISHAPFAFPPENGHLRGVLRDTDDGLEVEKLWEMPSGAPFFAIPPCTLRQGDILLSIDGRPTPNREAYRKLVDTKSGDPVAVSGDAVRLVVRRGGEQVELRDVRGPPSFPRFAGQTPRSSGFPRVLSVNANATTELCGGPVIDRTGRAIGIAIAWRNNGWLFVLPADTARSIAGEED